MINVLNLIRHNIVKNFNKLPIHIDTSTKFIRPCFYVTIDMDSSPTNQFYDNNVYYININYFGKLKPNGSVDTMDILDKQTKLNKIFNGNINYEDLWLKVYDREFTRDANNDLVLKIKIEDSQVISDRVKPDPDAEIINEIKIKS